MGRKDKKEEQKVRDISRFSVGACVASDAARHYMDHREESLLVVECVKYVFYID